MNATGTYTVLGFFDDVIPLAVGAVRGTHTVEGDLSFLKHMPWSAIVEADSPDDAIRIALKQLGA